MPPRKYSRHQFTCGLHYGRRLLLADRERFAYRNYRDNRVHVVKEGDTLWHLAGRYFDGVPRACGLWWIIADFQPNPIHDPTLALQPGTTLIIPSLRTVVEEVFNTKRQREARP